MRIKYKESNAVGGYTHQSYPFDRNMSCNRLKYRIILVVPLIVSCISLLASFNSTVTLTKAIQSHLMKTNYRLQSNTVNHDDDGPKLIWLMSYPNSGNSFTTFLVRTYTNSITATNYGENHLNGRGSSVPIYNGDQYQRGPFIVLTPSSGKSSVGKYVLTKTHCGGRCTRCAPDNYLETKETFKKDCLSARKAVTSTDGFQNESITYKTEQYEEKLVAKAIHIIRNPLDNVVSRYHLFLKMIAKGKMNDFFSKSFQISSFTNDSQGFTNWCEAQDSMYPEEEKASFEGTNFYKLFQNIPCHADFFRYAKWHNHASEVISEMSIPSMILYYEDFASSFNKTKERLFQFIEVQEENVIKKRNAITFDAGKNYSTYYTEEQQEAIWQLLETVCDRSTYLKIHSRYRYDH